MNCADAKTCAKKETFRAGLPLWMKRLDMPQNCGIWQVFGWPYETTMAMTRLVFSGVLESYPELKMITHHCGAMVPYFAERIAMENDIYGMRMGFKYEENLTLDYYRKFYGDTAVSGSIAALTCGYAFLGADHILFGTDMPFDSQLGDRATGRTILSIKHMDIPESEKKKIFEDNARRLFRFGRLSSHC